MKTDKELADELDAQKRLEGHGYIRHACDTCHGTGMQRYSKCFRCEGKGHTWESPLMRTFRQARESITPETVKQARDSVDKAMKRAAVQIRKMDEAIERKVKS